MTAVAKIILAALWGIACFGLAACGDRQSPSVARATAATKEQFEGIEIGMSEEQVEAILGPPTRKTEGYGTDGKGIHRPIVVPYYYAGVGGAVIEIQFYLDHVSGKHWIEPDSRQNDA
jgi:hypothetical protein